MLSACAVSAEERDFDTLFERFFQRVFGNHPVKCVVLNDTANESNQSGDSFDNASVAIEMPVPRTNTTEMIVESPGQTVCIQVITPAVNDATLECREFPTPCDVPEGWTQVSGC